ncbi:MAG TPA: proton-conducting transporter membrane subunit [Anaerolineae bacterium]|nr:proton-conducting transporter membrane subunit [Anaerolineae bacterium]
MTFLDGNLLSLIIFSPLIGLVVVAGLPKDRAKPIRWVGLITTLIPLALTLLAWIRFVPGQPSYQFEQIAPWFPQIGVNYRVGVDGISLPLMLLTAVLSPLAALVSFSVTERVKAYFILFLLLETAMLGAFAALDLIIFFIFFEFTLVPMMLLIMVWGGENRRYAAFKFMVYTMAGSVAMLLAFQVIGVTLGSFDLAVCRRERPNSSPSWHWARN